jgi:hypothetical protein
MKLQHAAQTGKSASYDNHIGFGGHSILLSELVLFRLGHIFRTNIFPRGQKFLESLENDPIFPLQLHSPLGQRAHGHK